MTATSTSSHLRFDLGAPNERAGTKHVPISINTADTLGYMSGQGGRTYNRSGDWLR